MRPIHLGLAAALVLASLTAGCAGSDPGPDPAYRISGSFTENATQADTEDLREKVAGWGAEVQIMESHPMQYRVHGFAQADCDAIRAVLEERPYIATVGDCAPVERASNGDEPTSNGT